jgi:glucose/arabinose dehydrogenase
VTGALWVSEHGPQGGDELNLVRAGANYGWPVITYGVNYVTGTKIGEGTAEAGLEQPVKYWTPSPALAGIAFVDGDKFPKWRGDLLVATMKANALIRVRLSGDRFVENEFLLKGELPRVRQVRLSPDGYIYLLTDEARGAIVRLSPGS